MTKEEIAGTLNQIGALLELKGENPFKIRAYVNAARAIETFGGNIPDLRDEEAVAKIPGIGKSIALKIKELASRRHGHWIFGSNETVGISEIKSWDLVPFFWNFPSNTGIRTEDVLFKRDEISNGLWLDRW